MFLIVWILTAPYFLFMPTYRSYSKIWFFISVSFWDISIESFSCFSRFSLMESTTALRSSTSSRAFWSDFSSSRISSCNLSIFSSSLNFSSWRAFFSFWTSSVSSFSLAFSSSCSAFRSSYCCSASWRISSIFDSLSLASLAIKSVWIWNYWCLCSKMVWS